MKTLKIIKGVYGVSEHDAIFLDYGDGSGFITYLEDQGLPVDVIDRIGYAIQNGFKLEFIDERNDISK